MFRMNNKGIKISVIHWCSDFVYKVTAINRHFRRMKYKRVTEF